MDPGNRDEAGRFPPGVSGNPNGRPKVDPEARRILAAATADAARKLVEGLEAMKYVGLDGRAVPDWKERRDYAIAIYDRIHGRPAQSITDADGGPLTLGLVVLPAEESE